MPSNDMSIILSSEIDDDTRSLVDFTPEVLVPACVQCLKIIIPDFDAPATLPEAMAARLRVCTVLANTVQVIKQINDIP